jgi:hypothetical protein
MRFTDPLAFTLELPATPQKFVAKLWPEYPTLGVEETVKSVKICKNGRNYAVAATPEKSNT